MESLVVYTAIVGQFNDVLFPIPTAKDPSRRPVRYVCFSDRDIDCPPGWERRLLRAEYGCPRLTARWHKIMSHVLFPEVDITIWHDGSNFFTVNPWNLVDCCLTMGREFATFRHPKRDCVYQEIEACIALRKDIPKRLLEQGARYRGHDYPAHNGLIETSCSFRRW